MQQTVLVVEDEHALADVVIDYLHHANYQTHHIDNGLHVVDWVKTNRVDLILLDLMLPGKDGIAICNEIRQFSSIPILMVTAKVDEVDRLLGLEIGADDYICKPFSPRELVARVKANLRRTQTANEEPALSDLHLDSNTLKVTLFGQAVNVTAVEFRLLNKMANSVGQIFSRSQLIDAIYEDGRIVSERTVDSHIKKLRKQLHAAAPEKTIIHSIYGVGYKVDISD